MNKWWIDDEVNILREMLLNGHTYDDISNKLNRSTTSIKKKCIKLGIIYDEPRLCNKCNKGELETRKHYCDSCKYEYYHIYRPRCEFKFSLNSYPNEYNFDLIVENGWYSPTDNLDGVSRDHILSVKQGFENKIDPMIISHPANCELMLHRENNSKNTNSNITLEELLDKISEWDKKYSK